MSFCNNKFHSNLLLSKKEILRQVMVQRRHSLNDSKTDFCGQNAIFTWLYPLKEICICSVAVFMLINGAPPLVEKCWAKFGLIRTVFWEWKRKLGGREGWLSGRLFVKVNTCCTHTGCFSKSKAQGEISAVSWKHAHLHFPETEVLSPARTEELVYWEERDKMGGWVGEPWRVIPESGWAGENTCGWGLAQWEQVGHSPPTRSAQSHFLLLQNLLHQLTAEFGCGWAGKSASVVDTHSSFLGMFKMQIV